MLSSRATAECSPNISKKEIVLEEITTDFFGNAIDCTIDEKVWLPAADINKILRGSKLSTMSIIQRQYQRYYAMEVSEDVTSKLESARTQNMDSEEVMGMFSVQVMGMFSAGQSRAPSASLVLVIKDSRQEKQDSPISPISS